MKNPFIVVKKPVQVSGLPTRFSHHHQPLGSSVVISSPFVLNKKGNNGTSGFFLHPLGVGVAPVAGTSSNTIPARQKKKEFTDSRLSSDDEDDDEPSFDVLKNCDPDDDGLDLLRKFMDELVENPNTSNGGVEKCKSHAREDDVAVYLTCEMPGLSKKDVKVTVEKKFVVIKGEEKKETSDGEKARKYCCKIKIEPKLFKINEIKAEMKNGLLKVILSKLKEEERKDIIDVKVD
ncbi:hypothetical protein AQUCO_03500206v1 [Aquilegia coerulea]|uniref:SHSP domain-containing protein n=1 Tax=Aquilegia coerulea TaxID=218851 RepID=A0A2G5CWQ0_AQUCA|nr:hypothetical protein AQUCO_03500206v1 [Aquilegia coerulea]